MNHNQEKCKSTAKYLMEVILIEKNALEVIKDYVFERVSNCGAVEAKDFAIELRFTNQALISSEKKFSRDIVMFMREVPDIIIDYAKSIKDHKQTNDSDKEFAQNFINSEKNKSSRSGWLAMQIYGK